MLLSEEHRMIQHAIRDYVRERIVPFAAQWDRDHTFPRDALQGLGALGALGITVPAEWGGAGLDTLAAALVIEEVAAGDLTKAVAGADKALITEARVFDVYRGPGVPEGSKSVAVEILVQPREKTLTEAEIEALSAKVVAAADKAVSAKLRT